MPPAMFTASKPHWASCSVALADRAPERHTQTMRRLIGIWKRADSRPPSGTHRTGRVPGLPFVGLAHVEQHGVFAPGARVDDVDLLDPLSLPHAHEMASSATVRNNL